MKLQTLKKLHPIIPIVLFIILWQILSTSGIINPTLFPPPSKVFLSFIDLGSTGELTLHIRSSIFRVLFGLVIGSLIGIVFGLLTGRIKFAEKSLSPLFQVLRSFPPVAIIPLIIVWLGIGETAKLFSISFAVFFPVWINTHIGASRVPDHYMKASYLLTKSIYNKLIKVIIPASLPFIIAGIRTGIAIAYIMIFVSELAGSSSGLGYLISVSHLSYRIDKMIVGLILLGFFGAFTDFLFVKITRRLFPWIEKI